MRFDERERRRRFGVILWAAVGCQVTALGLLAVVLASPEKSVQHQVALVGMSALLMMSICAVLIVAVTVRLPERPPVGRPEGAS